VRKKLILGSSSHYASVYTVQVRSKSR